jgi:hypothetical protein
VGQVLVELSKVEQRYDAVQAVMRDGLTISEAALTYRVSRQTLAPDLRLVAEDRSGEDWISCYVTVNGVISVINQVLSVGKHRAGQTVDVRGSRTIFRSGMALTSSRQPCAPQRG